MWPLLVALALLTALCPPRVNIQLPEGGTSALSTNGAPNDGTSAPNNLVLPAAASLLVCL